MRREAPEQPHRGQWLRLGLPTAGLGAIIVFLGYGLAVLTGKGGDANIGAGLVAGLGFVLIATGAVACVIEVVDVVLRFTRGRP